MSVLLLLPLLIGAAAIFLLLPRPRALPVALGAIAGLATVALVGLLFAQAMKLSAESLLFFVFATIAVVSGSLLVTQQNPARAALSFALVVLSTSGLFLLLAAPFLMAATIIVYAGAIVVTFLFVLMLAAQAGLSDADARSREPLLATIAGFVLLGGLLYILNVTYTSNDNARLLDELLTDVREAQANVAEITGDKFADQMLGRVNRIKKEEEERELVLREQGAMQELRALQRRADFAGDVRRRIEPILAEFPSHGKGSPDAMKVALARLAAPLAEMRQEMGMLRPAFDDPLSPLSGPPASVPFEELRVDEHGRPRLPAENTQYLGRSLFTDYLVAVELGGILLLVATVGAIAIAQRRVLHGRPL